MAQALSSGRCPIFMLRACARQMSKSFEYLIVGGGNAAGYACRELAAQGVAAGKVGIVTAETVPPYERPALTKAYLHPPTAKVRARLPGFHTCVGGGGDRQTSEWYAEKGISFVQGRATAVDLAAKTVAVGEDTCAYDKLILATGARPLRVSQFGVKGDDLKNVFYIREEPEAAALVQALEALGGAGKAVIVGGGYIGLECAAALVGWGVETTMVFPEANCMPRLFNAELGKWLEDEYAARGVKILKGDLVTEFLSEGEAVSGVRLKSGQTLPCSVAVVGVGASPNVEFCSGLAMDKGGFAVDPFMKTSDPSVFAIGDVCAFPSAYGGTSRCEHVDHARKSAKQAVMAAMGLSPEPYKYLPYFYSRVFEYSDAPIVFNFFGDESGECHVCARGEKSIGAIWVKDGRVTGALLMGSPGPTADDQAKLRELVAAQPAAVDAAAAFAAAKL
uniref:monodehydroascorbate reductase (NADH) n=1 Tax=Alexandrium monilatum TaxID=311494 RepID=A0A7S4W9V9_9DINO